MTSPPELIGKSMYGRALYLSTIEDLDEWRSTLAEPSPYFVLLLVLDANRFTDEQLRAFADKIATQGVGYVYVWGPDADRVHFIFDLALYVENEGLRREVDDHDATILTSSDEDEDLDDAIDFAVFYAHPDDYYYAAEGGIRCSQWSSAHPSGLVRCAADSSTRKRCQRMCSHANHRLPSSRICADGGGVAAQPRHSDELADVGISTRNRRLRRGAGQSDGSAVFLRSRARPVVCVESLGRAT